MFASYFEKLDIKPQELSIELVQEIQTKHLASFSFNNIAVLLGDEIFLESEKIFEKVVTQNLGGYCFEHNALLYEALKTLGFKVRLLLAKVLNNMDVDAPRTHRVTLLEFQGENYLIDVGFGALSPREPLKLDALYAEDAPFRIIKENNAQYRVQIENKKNYFTLYKFDLHTYTHADCIMGNFYSSNYKDAVFVNNLVVSLIKPELTLSLRNRLYHRIYKDKKETINIQNSSQLQKIINEEFQIPLSIKKSKILYTFLSKFSDAKI